MFSNLLSIGHNSKPSIYKFKYQETPVAKRQAESTAIRLKYPDRIPVICEVVADSRDKLQLDRNKYLVPHDLSIGQFMVVLRKRIQLNSEQAIFIFTENSEIPSCSHLMSQIYQQSKNIDGFVYFTLALENTFGSV
jgi:GABA(A) receptor-associated protein